MVTERHSILLLVALLESGRSCTMLNHSFMHGVNFGGWLVRENWIFPDEMPKGTDDEFTLIKHMGGPTSPAATTFMHNHWKTFVTENDLETLAAFGITHVRIPVGWWTFDYDENDGFVDGSKAYLDQILDSLQQRGMHALLDLHALPGSQSRQQSFTGKMETDAFFFSDPAQHERGKKVMLKLAQYIKDLESIPSRANAVMGMELVNEPLVAMNDFPNGAQAIQNLYEEMVPKVREILPAHKYAIFLCFVYPDLMHDSGQWLASKIGNGPAHVWCNVIYDRHMYHAYGDDDGAGPPWNKDMDKCKTCCRDHELLKLLGDVPFVLGEWSLTTGTLNRNEHNDPDFLRTFWADQVSNWVNSGARGSFFWEHRILSKAGNKDWFLPFDLVQMITGPTKLTRIPDLDLSRRCPGTDLTKCPTFDQGGLTSINGGSMQCWFQGDWKDYSYTPPGAAPARRELDAPGVKFV